MLIPTPVLAWYFVLVWGVAYVASRTGLQYAGPLTFLALRFGLGIALLAPLAWWQHGRCANPAGSGPHSVTQGPTEPWRWPSTPQACAHVVVAGLLMHGVNLGFSHQAQALGMPAGVSALVLALQPLLTLAIAQPLLGERAGLQQIAGILLGLVGVAMVVEHNVRLDGLSTASLASVLTALVGITAGTLYQRRFCRDVDLRPAGLIQFAAVLSVFAPLSWWLEGWTVQWTLPLLASLIFLVLASSILAVNALHLLMRRGAAVRVTSLLYLTPIIASLAEAALFGVVPSNFAVIGMLIALIGVWLATRN